MRTVSRFTPSVGVVVMLAVWLLAGTRGQGAETHAVSGAWTLNKDLSDQPPGRGDQRDQGDSGREDRGAGGGRRRGGGGFGGGRGMGRGGGMGRGRAGLNPQDMPRLRAPTPHLPTP